MCPAEKTLTVSHLVDDDIDTCTMEEARNFNFCRTNVDGASELQHKIVYYKCMKALFGHRKYDSVTNMLLVLGLHSCDTISRTAEPKERSPVQVAV